ncbi:glycosyltransferase family 2 protein [uncultured Chryseobacterium sp.]|uniref:glycosyltransferase family 2 protein n=1 Tax=uncultured Chryseobacterium sp. TaxID=259322 RepID=UPI0026359FDA|nr:glycosyltransferase family 2 protein [uncultured Chryseobacterium sp.]
MISPLISTVILTFNEEKHIERCIKNAQRFSSDIFLVDSFSTDCTVQIAESLGAKVLQNKWENNHSKQLNWGLENLPITTEWVFRLDADEYLSDELISEINTKIAHIRSDVSGIVMERKMIFLGKLINRGNVQWNMLRLFRNGKGKCEERWMDEHIVLSEGKSVMFDHCFYDDNLNPLGWWITKHNGYSIREAVDLLNLKYHFLTEKEQDHAAEMSEDAGAKRRKKEKYNSMPLFWRSFVYFLYRYFGKLGFTEGKEGFLWHFLQGWWYRTLVDAKIYEIEKACKGDASKIKSYIEKNYGLKLE